MKPSKGGIIILTGPSGSGKSSLIKTLFECFDDLHFSVSCTTRSPRTGEVDGEHYYFISEKEFLEGIECGQFVEYAQVHGHFYGTTHKELKKGIDEGKVLLLDIDVQGHANIKKAYQDVTLSIFVAAPSKQELALRLKNRASDDEADINKRMACALNEMLEIEHFDYVIVNDELQEAKKRIISIVESFKSRSNRYDLKAFVKSWNES